MANTFKVNFFNNGAKPGSVMLFQRDPSGNPSAQSLAWFAKYTYPATRVTFEWTTDLSFVWCDTGQLVPGIIAGASQSIAADPRGNNQITLTYAQAFNFVNLRQGGSPGTLLITADASIPPGMASVGIGMSGQPAFLVQAQPNMNSMFSPSAQYWIAFGTYEAGQVLDITLIGKPAHIVFPTNIYAMDATLGSDGNWTISPTHLAAEV
jgi:hypothetical protein